MKSLSTSKKFFALAICGALVITVLGISLIQSQASGVSRGINAEKAAAIALENAGVKQESAAKLSSSYDQDKGKDIFEVSFYANDFEYDYVIAASDGTILEAKREMMNSEDYKDAGLANPKAEKNDSEKSDQAQQPTAASSYIGTDKAKSIALKQAGLSLNNVNFTKAKLDKEDGVYVYELEFVSGAYEYDFEIDAKSGNIIDYDVDDIDD